MIITDPRSVAIARDVLDAADAVTERLEIIGEVSKPWFEM
jgi:hypothetical protein